MALLLLTALAVAGCSEQERWQTTPLNSEFPQLRFELTVADEAPLTERALAGKVTLMFFGYTSCPDVCPTTMAKLRDVLESLPAADRERVRVLFVSVDPARDDPEHLASYAAHFGPQFIGATSDPETLERLTSRYGSTFRLEDTDKPDYLVAHGSRVLAFDAEGEARLMIREDDSTEAIAGDVRRLL